ncbi:15-hydroxyprostaglandin dehydrogenase [NAD(+)] [Holothuria leucospilota]|uniref:15-hydroxyprostaglandin dehydrogenase [NAD(+)] n=1 Tax=Holothuria leucospilota TaxID=206669 RepID=A0A9Q1HFC1_HOLLE|nr:15-hydroxyprostaglandin dehydrogenase [NAD(+)] [Holothuria leucospilota]
MKVNGVCAIVTGAARGIGKEVVKRLLSKGAKFVAIIDIQKELGEETEKEFQESFGSHRVRFIHCDVTSEIELSEAFEIAYYVHGRLDVVVNNAGILTGPKVLQVNLEAVIRSSYLAKKYMSKLHGGSGGVLVNTSSVAGFIPFGYPVYAASKHGVIGFSLALTENDPSFLQSDIRVGVICPSHVETNIFDSSPAAKASLQFLQFVPISQVVDAFLLVIEDDTKHGCCVRISKAKGVDLLPMKTVEEWESELMLNKS